MRLWRLAHLRHADRAWQGEGARRSGGRWNSVGRPVVYASEHAALAVLEVLVHVTPRDLPRFRLHAATVPGRLVHDLPPTRLPPRWGAYPHTTASQRVGDEWLAAGEHLALRVPSALVPGSNILLNPRHGSFRELDLEPEALEVPYAHRMAGAG